MAYDQQLADAEAALKRWYEAASPYTTPEALKEALSKYVSREAIWKAACRAQREADKRHADGLLPGSYIKNIDAEELVAFDESCMSK